MRQNLILVIAFGLFSCGLVESSANKSNHLKESVLGSWTSDISGKVVMEIRKTKVYYPWMPAKLPYKIVGDTIELTRVDGTYIGPINWRSKAILKNDTLLVFEEWGVKKYWRVKSNK